MRSALTAAMSPSFLFLWAICATLVEAIFLPTEHAGGEAPYFDAPSQYGVSSALPNGCTVDQAAYITRHGSRYPEPGSFTGWVNLHTKLQNTTYTAEGPLAFLPTWTPPVDDPALQTSFLSTTGSGEAFALGVKLRNRYGFTRGGENFTVWAASQQRVVDTASYFLSGYLSSGHYNTAALSRIITLPDSVNYTFANSLTASAACPNYVNQDPFGPAFRDTFLPEIANRLNKHLKGLTLTASDVGIMMDLCPYEMEIRGSSSFCGSDVFSELDWQQFEYSHDLKYYYGSGPGNPLSATTTYPLIKSIAELFSLGPGKTTSNGTFTPPPLLMGFTHDNDIAPVATTLGLFNESFYAPLSPMHPNPARKFRASYIVPFRGTVALEALRCAPGSSREVHHIHGVTPRPVPTKRFVRVLVNEAAVPIPKCSSGPGASCPMEEFTKYVEERGKLAGDFVQRCGLSNVSNATSVLDFFTNPPE